jgi:predicted adenine nucleotide alpha hydrolase (AANH) superfamily ATPase
MLVHMCCGPCSIIPLKSALKDRYDIRGFFHNPNIHPYSEFLKRLSAVKTLASYLSIELICDEEYRPTAFVKGMKASIPSSPKFPPKGLRCSYCYSERLEKTARTASLNGFDSFSTSLLYSRYQNHDEVKRLGVDLGKKYGILFYYEDFRTGWQDGIDASKEMGLYRQKYCGCAYSRIERYAKKTKTKQHVG